MIKMTELIQHTEKLNGLNYINWKYRIQALLEAKDLWEHLNRPTPTDPAALILWKKTDAQIRGMITISMENSQVSMILTCKTAKEIMTKLENRYAGDIDKMKLDAKNNVARLSMKENESWEEYLLRSEKLLESARSLGAVIEDKEFITGFIRGLSSKFNNLVMQFDTIEELTLIKLRRYFQKYQERQELEKENTPNAFKASSSKENNDYKNKRNFENKNKLSCYICGKNHFAKYCWYNKYNKYNENSNKKKYYKNNSDKKQKDQKARYVKENSDNEKPENNQQDYAWTVDIEYIKPTEWVLDSGATSHMTANKNLINIEKPEKRKIKLANNQSIYSEAIGTCKVKTINNLCYTLKDVLYVPELESNLLSINKLTENDLGVKFNRYGAVIQDKNNKILTAQRRKNMYILNQPNNHQEQSLKVENKNNTNLENWHKRLGHLNQQYMKMLKDNNMVRNYNYINKNDFVCTTCIQSKYARKPFRKIENKQSKEILELLHIDLVGPIQENSLGRSKYILTIVDDYSRKIFTKFLRAKSETLEKLSQFINQIENLTGKTVKYMRSDNGGELLNNEMTDFLNKKGIKHQLTTSYSPQSNGIAERANRTIVESGTAMLLQAKLPITFWAEAIATASYIKNKTPYKINGHKTPDEQFLGYKPSVGHLKTFGCLAYYWIPKNKHKKFKPKMRAGIFVGYSLNRRAYRIYDPEKRIVIESRDVRFLENEDGWKLLSNLKEEKDYDSIFTKLYLYENNHTENIQNEQAEDRNDRHDENNQNEEITNDRDNRETQHGTNINNNSRPVRSTRKNINYYEPSSEEEEEDANIATNEEKIPNTYNEAITSNEKEQWIEAMKAELRSLHEHDVWELVDIPNEVKPIKCRWVYAKKRLSEGKFKFKARLVAVGCSQKYGIDYFETYSPVIKPCSLRSIKAYGAEKGWDVHHFDVQTAYLYGKLEEEVYMNQPPGFIDKIYPRKICKLKQALYGLRQSGRVWYETLKNYLVQKGFHKFKSDPCVFSYTKDKSKLILGIYVDDFFIINSDQEVLDECVKIIEEKFILKKSIKTDNLLGLEINKDTNEIQVNQTVYVEKILKKFGMSDCNGVSTPLIVGQDLDKYEDSPEVNITLYQEMLGTISYLATRTRPDIAYPASELAKYSKAPRAVHMAALRRLFRYVKGTKHFGLHYSRKQNNSKLKCFADASWRDGKGNQRSTTGYLYMLGENIITWTSKVQKTVSLSTCDSEISAMTEAVKDGIFVQAFLQELYNDDNAFTTVEVYCDNKAAVTLSQKGTTTGRSNHLVRQVGFLNEYHVKGGFIVSHVSGNDQIADFLTKQLSGPKLKMCLTHTNIF